MTNNKKQWNQPELTVLGNVETLTLVGPGKKLGASDGFYLNTPNTPITNLSS